MWKKLIEDKTDGGIEVVSKHYVTASWLKWGGRMSRHAEIMK